MVHANPQLSTGLSGLDLALRGLIPGDNVVWHVGAVEGYAPFVEPYGQSALTRGRRLVYLRFADHPPLVAPQDGLEVHNLDADAGFEAFTAHVHRIIERSGRGAWYVFDCLSHLAHTWLSDSMLSNFFVLTCPYLYDVEAIAYFGLLRRMHAPQVARRISETCQVFLDVYRRGERTYVHPIKVQHRHSPTMYMLHAREADDFVPVMDSATTARILSGTKQLGTMTRTVAQGVWHHTFRQAERALEAGRRGEPCEEDTSRILRQVVRMAITRDSRMAEMVERYFDLADIVALRPRIVGTGQIGGKAVGMLLARQILVRADEKWAETLEPHDSFYVGSDVFCSFLVDNGLWGRASEDSSSDWFVEDAHHKRQRIIVGSFPDNIKAQFQAVLDYFGQSPIIVRSSSLLEDNFDNSFAGQYESVFLANQGSPEQRLHDFMSAVRTIYASTLGERALTYRARRNMLGEAERMALLVQRVSGAMHGSLFYPHLAGVGFSYNPYAWSKEIDPEAGVLRHVFGLGTRAVDRAEDDYTRIVALNAPERRPEGDHEEILRRCQRYADVLDLQANQLVSLDFQDVIRRSPDVPADIFATVDRAAARNYPDRPAPMFLTFDNLFRKTSYAETMRSMLRHVHDAYGCPVDVEYTTNFSPNGRFGINLVQCRPLQIQSGVPTSPLPEHIPDDDLLIEAEGTALGQSRACRVDRILYVVPEVYSQLAPSDRYTIARLIGKLTHLDGPDAPETIMLLGPGRWCTSSPSLGVPTSFGEIDTVSIICEIAVMHDTLRPEVSLGTHFFSELVETRMLYFAIIPEREGNRFRRDFFDESPNRLAELSPGDAEWEHAVRVIDAPRDDEPGPHFALNANTMEQRVVFYREHT